MPRDQAPAWGRYLTTLLAAAARPFRYRSAVHRLLGVPEEPERTLTFLPPLPPGAFRYETDRWRPDPPLPAPGSRRDLCSPAVAVAPRTRPPTSTAENPTASPLEPEGTWSEIASGDEAPGRPTSLPRGSGPGVGEPGDRYRGAEEGLQTAERLAAQQAQPATLDLPGVTADRSPKLVAGAGDVTGSAHLRKSPEATIQGPDPRNRREGGEPGEILAPGKPESEGVERLRRAVAGLKASRKTSGDPPQAQPVPPAAQLAPDESAPAAVVVRSPVLPRRQVPRSLFSLSTMRSRHFRILR